MNWKKVDISKNMDICKISQCRIWHEIGKIHIYILKNSECYVIHSGETPGHSCPYGPIFE